MNHDKVVKLKNPGVPGERLERLAETRGLPNTIVVDNGPEFTGRTLDAWA